jgi:UDP-N-acetylglucosamine 1-carboxyvinyltransferase
MPKLVIHGGKPLAGVVTLSGAKNEALPVLFGALLADAEVTLRNVPLGLNDIKVTLELLRALGAGIEVDPAASVVKYHPSELVGEIPRDLACRIRSSLLLLSIGLLRRGEVELPLPGGCRIGERKFDLHLLGLSELGANIQHNEDSIVASASGLVGKHVEFYLPTTSGTENIVLAATGAKGRTTIRNANTRPEIVEFCRFLTEMGADIKLGNREITVEGSKPLNHPVDFTIMSDRHEGTTYMVAAGLTGGEIRITNADLSLSTGDLSVLESAGVQVFEWGGEVYVKRSGPLTAFELETAPCPGVNSDMQPIFASLALFAEGTSSLRDTRFTDRFQYVPEMEKLGGAIRVDGNCARITGPQKLHGAKVAATDLRGGAALTLAALAVPDETVVDNAYQIYRGYEDFAGKLSSLGADVKLVEGD